MISLLLSLWISGAQAKPDAWLPDSTVSWPLGATAASSTPTRPWWQDQPDAGLAELLDALVIHNPDLAGAWARAEQSRSLSHAQLGALVPSISGQANMSFSPTSALGFQFGGLPSDPNNPRPDVYYSGQATLSAQWNIDLFFKQGSTWQASRHDAAAAAGDQQATRLSLATTAAEAWYDAVAARERRAVLQRQIDATGTLLELVTLRFEGSEATALDVLQQRQQLQALSAQLPSAETAVSQSDRRLAVLLGTLPGGDALPTRPGALPEALGAAPAPPQPEKLALTRPDLASALDKQDAATWRKRAAARAMLPSLSASAQAGVQYINLGDFSSQNFWGAGLTLSVPIFQGGSLHAQHRAARMVELSASSAVTSTSLTAVAEVSNAIESDNAAAQRLAAVKEQHKAAEDGYQLARERYLAGLTNYLTLLTAQSTWLQAELSWLDARRAAMSSRIQLHDAIGGTWISTLPAPVAREDVQ